MLGRTRLVHAGRAAARAQSCAARVDPRPPSPRNPFQVSRCFSTNKPGAEKNSPKETTQKPRPLNTRPPRPSAPEQLGRLLGATSNGSSVSLTFEGRTYSNLPNIWFRDACPCPHCVSESSGQKKFATCDIDATPELESCQVSEDGSLELVWARDFMRGQSHVSTYPLLLLQRFLFLRLLPRVHQLQRYLWDRAAFEENMEARTIHYDAWMAGGQSFAKGLQDLFEWGLVLIKGLPESKDAVKDVANKIGVLQSTFYGETWDVVSKPDAENVAYTNEFLGLHQDLMYYKQPPYIQILHCIKNDCEGGDSLFSDGHRAAVEIKFRKPDDFNLLAKQPVTYHYSKNGHFYQQNRPVISDPLPVEDGSGRSTTIFWSPPFQGIFPLYRPPALRGPSADLPAWRNAAKTFKDSLEAPENMLQYRLQPGDCILFDNTRILHGRTKFDTSSGHRHLHGAYLQRETVQSALRREVGLGRINPPAADTWSAVVEQARAKYENKPEKEASVDKETSEVIKSPPSPAKPESTAAGAIEG